MTAETIVASAEQLRRGELTLTLVAKKDEPPRFLLRDLASLCRGFDGLIRAVASEVEPGAKIDWCVTALGLAGDSLSVTIAARGKAPGLVAEGPTTIWEGTPKVSVIPTEKPAAPAKPANGEDGPESLKSLLRLPAAPRRRTKKA